LIRRTGEAAAEVEKRKRATDRLLFFLKDGIEKIITKDKQHLSFDYILARIVPKCKYIISIAI